MQRWSSSSYQTVNFTPITIQLIIGENPPERYGPDTLVMPTDLKEKEWSVRVLINEARHLNS